MEVILNNLLISFTAVVIALCFVFYSFLKKQYKFWKELGVPGPEPKMIFGNTAPIAKMEMTDAELTDLFYKQFRNEEYVGYYNFWKPVLLVRDLKLLKTIMENDFEYFEDRSGLATNTGTDSVLCNLFSLKGEVWKSRRNAFSKLFTPKKLKEYFDDMQVSISYLMKDFEVNVNQDIRLEEFMKRHGVRSICMQLYGLDLSRDEERIEKFVEYADVFSRPAASIVIKSLMSTISPLIFKIFKLKVFPPSLYYYFANLVDEMSSLRKKNNVTRNDLLEMITKLKEEGISLDEKMSAEEAVGHIYTFFTASFDSTELAVCHTFLQLALNPKAQDKARKEVDEVLKGSETITYEHISEMHYLDAVVNETLRIIPPVGTWDRVCTKPYKIDDKFTIPKGLLIKIPALSIQNDPVYFSEPEKFKPERFFDSNGTKDAWLPFGTGPRYCLGMRSAKISLKLTLAKTLSRYVILPSDKMVLPMKYDAKTVIFSARPTQGFWIKLQKRDL